MPLKMLFTKITKKLLVLCLSILMIEKSYQLDWICLPASIANMDALVDVLANVLHGILDFLMLVKNVRFLMLVSSQQY